MRKNFLFLDGHMIVAGMI
ncbi:MAG TPA: hypothetical protein DDW42_05855 [Desulfobacteraceae bacterium]|nr:hypothetical protein [Desulfobacteraceae bacterium]